MRLINCEAELDLRWGENCVISGISRIFRVVGDQNADGPLDRVTKATNSATFQISHAKLYLPVVTLPITDNIKFIFGKTKARI